MFLECGVGDLPVGRPAGMIEFRSRQGHVGGLTRSATAEVPTYHERRQTRRLQVRTLRERDRVRHDLQQRQVVTMRFRRMVCRHHNVGRNLANEPRQVFGRRPASPLLKGFLSRAAEPTVGSVQVVELDP